MVWRSASSCWINGAMGGRFITTLCFLRIEVFLLVRGFIFLDGFEIDRFY